MPTSDTVPFRAVTDTEVEQAAATLGLDLTGTEREDYRSLVADAVGGLAGLDEANEFDPGLRPESLDGRSVGKRPNTERNPSNAWITRFEAQSTDQGPLSDITVGLKDSIAVAGYEMTAGSAVLDGFTPRIDATVTRRLLGAGARIVGKLNMESFAWSGTGEFSDYGPVTNPHDESRLAGGSSSGSGAAPANGDCDIALGTDQAGSIRIPSSWCGLAGLKPTHGLVPYTGILPLEQSIDHVGPMARSVTRVAHALDVIAGVDSTNGIPLDPRQRPSMTTQSYADAVDDPPTDISIGVVETGFGWEQSEEAVDETVREAIAAAVDAGVSATSVDIPEHRDGFAAWAPIATQGGTELLRRGGVGTGHGGWEWTRLARALDSLLDARAEELPPSVKRSLLAAALLRERHGTVPYARARSVALELRRTYDEHLSAHDVLVLPTTVTRAFEHDPAIDRVDALEREVATVLNTCPFNLTGHPALSIPCGSVDGHPVGLMIVGARFDDASVLAAGRVFESILDVEIGE